MQVRRQMRGPQGERPGSFCEQGHVVRGSQRGCEARARETTGVTPVQFLPSCVSPATLFYPI